MFSQIWPLIYCLTQNLIWESVILVSQFFISQGWFALTRVVTDQYRFKHGLLCIPGSCWSVLSWALNFCFAWCQLVCYDQLFFWFQKLFSGTQSFLLTLLPEPTVVVSLLTMKYSLSTFSLKVLRKPNHKHFEEAFVLSPTYILDLISFIRKFINKRLHFWFGRKLIGSARKTHRRSDCLLSTVNSETASMLWF